MPARFTCRLLLTRTPGGKLRVRYGPLGDECVRVLTYHSPEMLIPPEAEMTQEEFERWQYELTMRLGCAEYFAATPLDAPLVEATRTLEDAIPKGSVKSELTWARRGEDGEVTLAVVIANGWTRPVPDFSLVAAFRYEAPQSEMIGDIRAQLTGGTDAMFFPAEGGLSKELWPGQKRSYVLDPRALPSIKSRAAALSPESHWLSLRTAGQEFDKVPGAIVAQFLESELEAGE